jgi:predicted nucleic acid-binding protein
MIAMRVYLDNCCYNRPFDDQGALRIRLEAEAKMGIQDMTMKKTVELAWSYVLDFENELNPFQQRRMVIREWRTHAVADTDQTTEIIERAEQLETMGMKAKDALHVACAIALKCDHFITTDDHLIRRVRAIAEIKVTDPVTFVREEAECLQTPK